MIRLHSQKWAIVECEIKTIPRANTISFLSSVFLTFQYDFYHFG